MENYDHSETWPLLGYKIAFVGVFAYELKKDLERLIKVKGGVISSQFDPEKITHIICPNHKLGIRAEKIDLAKKYGITILLEDDLKSLCKVKARIHSEGSNLLEKSTSSSGSTSALSGCQFALMGKFSVSRAELSRFILEHGGQISKLNGKVTHLVCNQPRNSLRSSRSKTLANNIPIISETELRQMTERSESHKRHFEGISKTSPIHKKRQKTECKDKEKIDSKMEKETETTNYEEINLDNEEADTKSEEGKKRKQEELDN